MAFTVTKLSPDQSEGSLKKVILTFENTGGDTGGIVNTGLTRVLFATAQHTGAAVVASAPVFNNTFPTNGGSLTLVTVADADGVIQAVGY